MTCGVPFLDMKAIVAAAHDDLMSATDRVLRSGWLILGEELAAFEAEYARYCEVSHCVGVANGLDAMALTLRALGVGEGDEVIVPSNTYIATWLAVSQVGAVPVPVEPVEATYNIDPAGIAATITPRTKVVLPVHLYGQPADMRAIFAVSDAHGLTVLEDGAQAHGARWHGTRVGSGRSLVAWSFYPGKNLGALGDGGGVTTSDATLADAIAVLRNYGSSVKYHNEIKGFNSRLDELQAALLRVKLGRLDRENGRRKEIAQRLSAGLAGTGLILPHVPDWADPAWHVYVVRHPDRDGLAARLRADGVATMVHYPIPPHLQPAYAELGLRKGAFPISEAIHREVLSLPMGPTMTDAQVDQVIAAVRRHA